MKNVIRPEIGVLFNQKARYQEALPSLALFKPEHRNAWVDSLVKGLSQVSVRPFALTGALHAKWRGLMEDDADLVRMLSRSKRYSGLVAVESQEDGDYDEADGARALVQAERYVLFAHDGTVAVTGVREEEEFRIMLLANQVRQPQPMASAMDYANGFDAVLNKLALAVDSDGFVARLGLKSVLVSFLRGLEMSDDNDHLRRRYFLG